MTGSSTGGEAPASTETGAPAEELCEAGECVVLPDDWNGPVVRLLGHEYSADDPIDCDAAWPDQVGDVLHANVIGGSASCDCECNETQAPVCGGQTGTLRMRTGCSISAETEETWTLSPGSNSPGTQATSSNRFWRLSTTGTDTAAVCEGSNFMQDLPQAERVGKVRLCASLEAEADPCVDGMCVPPILAPFGDETDLCVWREGNSECPAAFPAHHTYYRGQTDNRTCSGCSCSAQGDACTDARAVLIYVTAVGGNIGATSVHLSDGNCIFADIEPNLFSFIARAPNANTCQQTSPSSPTGSVQPSDPVTVCCRG